MKSAELPQWNGKREGAVQDRLCVGFSMGSLGGIMGRSSQMKRSSSRVRFQLAGKPEGLVVSSSQNNMGRMKETSLVDQFMKSALNYITEHTVFRFLKKNIYIMIVLYLCYRT